MLHEPATLDLDDFVLDHIGQVHRLEHVLENILEFDPIAAKIQGNRLIGLETFFSDRWFVDQDDQSGHFRNRLERVGQGTIFEGCRERFFEKFEDLSL